MFSLLSRPFFDSYWTETNKYSYYLSGGDFIIESDVPGFSKEDLEVEISDNVLLVSGKTKRRELRDKITVPRRYCSASTEIEASVENGVLRVVFKGVQELNEKKRTKLLLK